MEAILKNNRGFALAVMTALLPVLVGGLLATWALVAFIQTDLKLNYLCRSGGLSGQEQVAPLLHSLLSMNAPALRLRLELTQARTQAASGNPVALARLAQVEFRVRSFEFKQQQLVHQSNLLLVQAHTKTRLRLLHDTRALTTAIPLFNGSFQIHTLSPPRLAVRPDSPDSPPTYSPLENFSEQQALVQKWQYHLTIIKPLQPFLSGSFRFERSCGVTLKQESLQWSPQIIAPAPKGRF